MQHTTDHQPSQDAAKYKSLLLQFPYAAHALVFCRDQDGGRVTIDADGRPVLHYWPSNRDQANIMEVRKTPPPLLYAMFFTISLLSALIVHHGMYYI